MNKQELIEQISKKTKMPKSSALMFTDAFVGTVMGALKKQNEVKLVGFGTWKKKRRKARTGRNPQTGAKIKIKAKNVVSWSTGAELDGTVN